MSSTSVPHCIENVKSDQLRNKALPVLITVNISWWVLKKIIPIKFRQWVYVTIEELTCIAFNIIANKI